MKYGKKTLTTMVLVMLAGTCKLSQGMDVPGGPYDPQNVRAGQAISQSSSTQPSYRSGKNDYIELDPEEIHYHAGNPDHLRYYGEYKARPLGNIVSFPIDCCDHLDWHTFGDIWYFFTSAIGGSSNSSPGSAIKVSDANVTNVVVIRGKNESSGNRFEAYLGYNGNEFEEKRKKRIHQIQLLALKTKSADVNSGIHTSCFGPASHFGSHNVNLEIHKLSQSPLERLKVLEHLLKKDQEENQAGKWKKVDKSIRNADVYRCNDAYFDSDGNVYNTEVYWTEQENKIKGITYKSHSK